MTYYELLTSLRLQSRDPSPPAKLNEEAELVWRLKTTQLTSIQEWMTQDLITLFRTSGANLNKQIPCRHCS